MKVFYDSHTDTLSVILKENVTDAISALTVMYVAFQSIAPETDIAFDLSKEYAAKSMHVKKTRH
jgi:hypothetical protein